MARGFRWPRHESTGGRGKGVTCERARGVGGRGRVWHAGAGGARLEV